MKKKKKNSKKEYSKKDIQKIKDKFIKKKSSKNKLLKGQTDGFHNDKRSTVVLINNKIYDLVPSEFTLNEISAMDLPKRPHVRYLNPIPLRSEAEQAHKNKEVKYIDKLNKSIEKNTKITSVDKAIKMGANVEKEVQRLERLKDNTKDPKEKRKIRAQLRKLDYRRYTKK